MQSGTLSERIVIEDQTTVVDPDTGMPTTNWAPVLEVWADIRFLSGVETIKAAAEVSIVRASMRIRRRPNRRVKPSMRVIYDGNTYNIEAVLPNRRQAYQDLLVKTIGTP